MKMKKITKIIFVLVVIFIVGLLIGYFLFVTKGKTIIISQLQNRLRPQVKIDSLRINFPFMLKIQRFRIENFLETEELLIQPSILSLFYGKIAFSKIALVNPRIVIERAADGNFNVASLLKSTSGSSKPVVIGSLIVKNGIINFIDKKISSRGFTTKITDLDMNISNPLSPRFSINAKIHGRDETKIGLVEIDGWISFLRKDMEANFELSHLDGVHFSPYFKMFLSNRKLKNAIVNSKINISSDNNEIDGRCHLEINDIIYEKPQQESKSQQEKGLSSPLSFVLGTKESRPKQLTLDFPIKGTLVPFKINFVKITGSIFTEMLQKTVTQEPQRLPEKIEAIGDKFKELGEKVEKIFKEKYRK
jgi:hypothetical protein